MLSGSIFVFALGALFCFPKDPQLLRVLKGLEWEFETHRAA